MKIANRAAYLCLAGSVFIMSFDPQLSVADSKNYYTGVRPADTAIPEIRELLNEEAVRHGDDEATFEDERAPVISGNDRNARDERIQKEKSIRHDKVKNNNKLAENLIGLIYAPGDISSSEIEAAIELLGSSESPKSRQALQDIYDHAEDVAANLIPASFEEDLRQPAINGETIKIKKAILKAITISKDKRYVNIVKNERSKHPKRQAMEAGDVRLSQMIGEDELDVAERALGLDF